MTTKEIPVQGSIEFRDAVMQLEKEGHEVFVRRAVSSLPVYRVIPSMGHMKMEHLFASECSPVHMEDFAQAMCKYEGSPKMIVFTKMPN